MAVVKCLHLRAMPVLVLLALVPPLVSETRAQDCNSNTIPDNCDIDCGPPSGPCDVPGCGGSADCNTNGVPDECELTQVFDLAADWSDAVNPNGPWSYNDGSGSPILNHFIDWDLGNQVFSADQPAWSVSPYNASTAWFKRTAAGSPAVQVPIGMVGTLIRPRSTVSWTSPFRGVVEVSGNVWGATQFDFTEIKWRLGLNAELFTGGQVASVPQGLASPQSLAEGFGGPAVLHRIVSPGDRLELSFEYQNCCPSSIVMAGVELRIVRLTDCNGNTVPDECDVLSQASGDCDKDGVPDECQADCNSNGTPDTCDIVEMTESDCNSNGEPDACDVSVSSLRWHPLEVPPPLSAGTNGIEFASMAFDLARRRVVLFGGIEAGKKLCRTDTWEWDGQSWTQLTGGFPTARLGAAMAYDGARNRMVLFGGTDCEGALYGDTWERSPDAVWTQVSSNGPSARAFSAMAFDSLRSRIVVVGGEDQIGTVLEDTWEWDGTTWLLRSATGPGPRSGHDMAFDSAHSQTILFGGDMVAGGNDTWAWDGQNWSLVSASGPTDVFGAKMSYDARRERIVLYGAIIDTITRDLWEWDGNEWSRTLEYGPNGYPGTDFGHFSMAFDLFRDSLVLFGGAFGGGDKYFDTTWELRTNSMDCNQNGIPDECASAEIDCNGNGRPDECDISFVFSFDCDANGVPDECETPGIVESFWVAKDGAWSDPNNWCPTVVPNNAGMTQYEVFVDGKTAVVTLDISPTILSLTTSNGGTVEVNSSSGASARSIFADLPIENGGALRARDGRRFLLDAASVSQATVGEICADGTGSKLEVNGQNVSGGNIVGLQGGQIELLGSGTLEDVMVQGDVIAPNVSVPNGQTGALKQTIVNEGVIAVGSIDATNATFLVPQESGTTLSGKGCVRMGNRFARIGEFKGSFTNSTGHRIEGAGRIFGEFMNEFDAIVMADHPSDPLRINAPGLKTNNGIFLAVNGGVLNIETNLGGNGRIEARGGTVKISGNTTTIADCIDVPPGSISIVEIGINPNGPATVTAAVLPITGGIVNVRNGSTVTISGTVTICPDPMGLPPTAELHVLGSTLIAGTIDLCPGGVLEVASTLRVVDSFRNALTDGTSASWSWGAGSVLMISGGQSPDLTPGSLTGWATLEAPSEDNGASAVGAQDNFSLRNITLAAGSHVSLVDYLDNGGGANMEVVYCENLTLGPGAVLNLNGLRLYQLAPTPMEIPPGAVGGGMIVDEQRAVRGDACPNGVADESDITCFVAILLGSPPTGPQLAAADLDGTGQVDGLDIQGFTQVLVGTFAP